MTKSETILTGIREFSKTRGNKFTTQDVSTFFSVSEDTARKVLRNLDGLQPAKNGNIIVWSFITPGGRNIKKSPEARNHKILRYFRAACYNADKLGLSQEEMVSRLNGWLDEYEIKWQSGEEKKLEENIYDAVVLERIRYSSGRIAAEPGDFVRIVVATTTFWVLREGFGLIWTTQDVDWMWQYIAADVKFEEMRERY
jgi:hypothetical protein